MPNNTTKLLSYDKVRTKSGRRGVVKIVTHGDTAHVVWEEEGLEFPIRACHLEVLEHGCLFPTWYYLKDKVHGRSN